MFQCVTEKDAPWHAVVSAYLSILAGLGELTMSMWAGHTEKSMSIYGIGIMAFVDIAGSVLVLSMWQCGSPQSVRLTSERRREVQYSAIIGVMMIFLGMFLIVDSFQRLVHRSKMDSSYLGLIDGALGTVCGFSLAAYKYIVGKSLDSPVIIADSVSSLCGGMISCLALLVVFVDDEWWWSDSSAGFTSALYTFYSGVVTVYAANSDLSKLNRLHRGGPRLAPDYVKRVRSANESQQQQSQQQQQLQPNFQTEVPHAQALEEDDDREERYYDSQPQESSAVLRILYRALGFEPPDSSSRRDGLAKSKAAAYLGENQKLLPSESSEEPA